MAVAEKRAAEIAGKRPHIGALAAPRLEHRAVLVGMVAEPDPGDRHAPRRKLELLLVAGEVVGAGAIDLERGVARRDLLDLTDEIRQPRLDFGAGWSQIASRDHLSIGVVGVGLGPEADREPVLLAAFDREGDGLGRLAECDRKHAGRERIERAGMPRLRRLIEALHARNGLRRGHPLGFVEDEPAVD